MENPVYVPADKGRSFGWKSDHAFVKVSSEESGGRFTLIEDNLTTEFRLPRHLHREHTETFYAISGKVEFELEGRTVVLSAGDTLLIPPGVVHTVRCLEPAKMLTLFEPAGLEKLFDAYAAMSEADMADPEKLRAVDLAHDNVVL
jgi:quercetin dioxygenase-like cupin family protein